MLLFHLECARQTTSFNRRQTFSATKFPALIFLIDSSFLAAVGHVHITTCQMASSVADSSSLICRVTQLLHHQHKQTGTFFCFVFVLFFLFFTPVCILWLVYPCAPTRCSLVVIDVSLEKAWARARSFELGWHEQERDWRWNPHSFPASGWTAVQANLF